MDKQGTVTKLEKGGGVIHAEGGEDIAFTSEQVQGGQYGSLREGSRVCFREITTSKGFRAEDIRPE